MAEVQNIDPKRKLFDALSKEKYYTKSYDDFNKQFSTPESVGKLYSALNKEGYYTKTKKDFEGTFFPKSNEVSTQGSKNTSQTSTEPSVISQSNPFGKVPTAKTIDVVTGKVGKEKINVGTSKPKNSFIQDLGNSVVAGVGQLGSIATSIPSGLIDTYGKMNPTNQGLVGGLGILGDWIKDIKTTDNDNLAIQYLGRMVNGTKELKKSTPNALDAEQFGKISEKYIGIPEEFNPLSPNNVATKYFTEVQKSNHDKANANYKGGIWEAIKNGEYSTAGKLATLGAVESLPLVLGMVASRGAGLSGNQLLTALGVGTTEVEYQQLKEQNPNIDKNILLVNAQLTGLGEAGSELVGTNLLYDQAKTLFKKGAKDEAEKLLKTGVKSFLDNMFKKSFVGASALSDSSGEMVNQVWKNAIDKWSGVDPERDYTDGVIDAGIISLVSSGGLAVGAKIASKIINPTIKQEVKEQATQISDLSKDVDNASLPEQTRGELLKQTVKTTEKLNNKIDKQLELFNQLTEVDQKKVESINDKIDVIDDALSAENITPTTKTTLEEQKVKLEEQLSEIKPQKVEPETQNISFEKAISDKGVFYLNGEKGNLVLDGQTLVFETNDTIREIGNIDELSKQDISEFGIEKEVPLNIQITEDNSVVIDGVTYKNNYSKVDSAINYDKDGNVVSINLETENGNKRTIRGQKAEEIAYQYKLKEFEQNATDEQINRATEQVAEVIRTESEVKPTVTKTKIKNIKPTEVKSEVVIPEVKPPVQEVAVEGVTPTPPIENVEAPQAEDKEVVPNAVQKQEAVPQSEDVEVSGIKKSLVSKEVVDKVDFDKISDKEFTELGKKLHETGEVKSKDIVKEIVGYTNKEGKKTEGNRRALQPSEVVALLYYKTDLDNQERDLLKKKNSILEKGGDTSSVDAELNEVQDNIFDFDQMALITADQQSLAFRLRKGLIDKDYNYVTQVEKYKATNKGVIPADVEAKFKEYDAKLKELKEQITEAEKRAQIAEEQIAVNNIVEDVKREQSNPKVVSKKDIKAKKELADAKASFRKAVRGSLGQMNSGGAINLLGEAAKLIKAYAKVGVVKIEDVLVEIAKDFGKKFTNSNEKLFRDAHNEVNTKKQLTPEQKRKAYISKLNRDIADLDKQIEERKRKLKPDPTDKYANDIEITELRELRDFKKEQLDDIDPVVKQEKAQLTQEELDAREVERKIKANEKSIQDLKEKIANPSNTNTKNTSLWTEEVGKLEVEKAKLRKELAERRKSLKPVPTQEEIELKQVEDKIKSTEKSIEDLERKLSENDLSVNRKQSSLWTKEIGNLEQKKKNLQKELEDRRKAKTPADIAKIEVDREIKRVERAIQTVKEKIDGKKITKKNTSLWTKEIGELNQQKQELQEQLDLQNSKPYIVDGQLTVPSRYIRGLVESGVTDINSISEQVLAEVQKDLPDATIREVRDAITRYGKTVNQTADAITTQINQAKSLGKLYSKLEDLQKGIIASKTATRTTKLTKEQIEIKKQIKVLEDALPKTEEQIEADNTKRLEAKKRYYKKFIEEKQQRLKDRNFAPKPKNKPITPDDELSKLEAEANEIRAKYEEAHFENEQLNRGKWEKRGDFLLEATAGFTRAAQAGLDLSPFGVQLAIYTATQRPDKVVRTFKDAFKFFKSEKFSRDFYNNLPNHPLYNIMKASGLALNYPNSRLGSQDYQLSGSAINKLWNFTVTPIKWVNQPLYERAVAFNPYRASERFFAGAVDMGRIQMFEDYVNTLRNDGISFENSQEQYKRAAGAVNNLTFRGDLQKAEGYSKFLSTVLFAPRKIKATFEIALNPYYYWKTYQVSPTVAKKQMLTMLQFLITASTTVIAINKLQDYFAGEDDDDEVNPDIFNIYSSDFMVARLGNTRLDLFAGMRSQLIALARLVTGNYKTTSSSKMKELGQDPMTPTRAGVIGKFALNKVSPIVSLGYKALDESKGKELDWDDEAVETIAPLWTGSLKDIHREHPREVAFLLDFLTLVGQSVNNYGGAEFLDKDKDKKLIDLIGRKNAAFQNKSRASIKIIDETTGEERGITKTEYQDYKKEFGEYVKEELQSRYKEFDEMPILQFEKELKNIKTNAKEYAEFSISKTVDNVDEISITENGKIKKYTLTPDQIQERVKMNSEWMRQYGNDKIRNLTKTIEKRDKISKVKAKMEASLQVEKIANKASQIKIVNQFKDKKIKLEIKE